MDAIPWARSLPADVAESYERVMTPTARRQPHHRLPGVHVPRGRRLNTQADPFPVKEEVQVVCTFVATPAAEVQVLRLTNARAGGEFLLRVRASASVRGSFDATTDLLKLGDDDGAVGAALARAGGARLGGATVQGHTAVNSTYSYRVTFEGYSGPLEALALETHSLEDRSALNTWYSRTVRAVKGTMPLRGTFTLSFRGTSTPFFKNPKTLKR